MDVETLRRYRTQILLLAEQITQEKQPGYTVGRKDVLSNFKTVAERMGVTPMQAWGVYFLKHVDSIVAAAKDPKIPQGEPLDGRFADAINYLCLGWALQNDKAWDFEKEWNKPSEVVKLTAKDIVGLQAKKIDYTGFDEAAKTGAPIETLLRGDERWGGEHPVPDGEGVSKDGRFDWHPNPDYRASNSNEPRYLHTWRRLTPFGWTYKSTAHSVPRGEDDGA